MRNWDCQQWTPNHDFGAKIDVIAFLINLSSVFSPFKAKYNSVARFFIASVFASLQRIGR